MKQYFLFVTFMILSGAFIDAQSDVGRTIVWPENPVFREIYAEGQPALYYISFKESGSSFDFPGLPAYSEVLIPPAGVAEYRIKNPRFEPFVSPEASEVKFLTDSLPTDIVVESLPVYDRGELRIKVSFIPMRRNKSGMVERLTGFELEPVAGRLPTGRAGRLKAASNSVLASGKWYKFQINTDGIYKITFEDILALGFTDPASVRVYGNCGGQLPYVYNSALTPDDLQENPLYMETGTDGVFGAGDYILFYGQGANRWKYSTIDKMYLPVVHDYSAGAYYFLTTSLGQGKRIANAQGGLVAESEASDYISVDFHEQNTTNWLKSGRGWAGESFESGTIPSVGFTIPSPDAAGTGKIKVSVLSRSPSPSTNYFATLFNGVEQTDKITISGIYRISDATSYYALEKSQIYTLSPPSTGSLTVGLQMSSTTPSALGWLNNIIVNLPSIARYNGSPLFLRDYRKAGKIIEFAVKSPAAGMLVWNLTDPYNVEALPTSINAGNLEFVNRFTEAGLLVAFDPKASLSVPVFSGTGLGFIDNQNLHNLPPVDYLIISHPDFLSQANRLADIHRNKGEISVEVVNVQKIYNEFSSGARDAVAIRNFFRHQYKAYSTTDPHALKYVLLFGDGSYDNKNDFAANTNYIPTFQSDDWLSKVGTYVSDDFFGILDDNESINGLLDVGVGRFICRNIAEAQMMVDKVADYLNPANFGPWQNRMLMIGDDEDGNIHMKDANNIANKALEINPAFSVKKVLLDAYQQSNGSSGPSYPDVNRIINEQMANGILIFNYNGHGGEGGLSQEQILNRNIINRWTNGVRRPVFITATCEFGRFDDYEDLSGGELVYMNDKGGAVSIFTTNRVVYQYQNYTLNNSLITRLLAPDANGRRLTLGEAMRLGKNGAPSSNNLKFGLYGDPAISLAYPLHRVVVDSINGSPVAALSDTVSAFDRVQISGRVVDIRTGNLIEIDGFVYPELYDKEKNLKTLANDRGDPFYYSSRENLLFKGKASLKKGRFSTSFILPKDIDYSLGKGKFILYSSAGGGTGNGCDTSLTVGGASKSTLTDNSGPGIELFINDRNFVNGGLTNQDPIVLAILSDSSGINITGAGIGHNISVVLDNKINSTYVLNDFYEGEADNYMAGQVRYPMFGIEKGAHQLKLKAWDIANNSSEETLDFVVADDAAMALDHVFNYPNPFTQSTEFYFEHNQPGTSVDVLIQVFTVSGRLVKTIEQNFYAEGFRPAAIPWDGRDDFGDKIGRGVYIYKIRVKTAEGKKAEKFERLVILN